MHPFLTPNLHPQIFGTYLLTTVDSRTKLRPSDAILITPPPQPPPALHPPSLLTYEDLNCEVLAFHLGIQSYLGQELDTQTNVPRTKYTLLTLDLFVENQAFRRCIIRA